MSSMEARKQDCGEIKKPKKTASLGHEIGCLDERIEIKAKWFSLAHSHQALDQ